MANLSHELLTALDVDESCDLDAIIARRDPDDFDALRRLLTRDPAVNPRQRARAVYALGRWGDPSVVDDIRALLPELDREGRIGAIDALGRLGTEAALDGILTHAGDPSVPVRTFVTRALGRIATPRAEAELRELARTDPSERVRSLAEAQLA